MDRTYQIVTNLSCNLDCSYCYERKYPRNNNIDDVIDFLNACFERDSSLDNNDDNGAIIDFIGGEPFMQPKTILAAIEEVEMLARKHNRPYIYSFSTNATLFNNKLNREIVEKYARKMSIGVSIDGIQKTHDKFRIYASTGKGSYDDVVAGYKYLKTLPLRELGVKATFTSETLPYYTEGMKNLIDLAEGVGTISGNVTYEDIIPRSMAIKLANDIIEVLEYWISKEHHLNPRSILTHITPGHEGVNMDNIYNPDNRDRLKKDVEARLEPDRVRPYCGSIKYMTCLGFDRNIYGCNRFMSTVTTRNAIGKLVGREIVLDTNNNLAKEVSEQYTNYPESCLMCPSKMMCGSCAAAPYENKDGELEARKEYHLERRQCGWTMALALVDMWWKAKFDTWGSVAIEHTCGCCNCECNKE